MEELRGTLERMVYESDEDGYTVARVSSAGFPDLITVVGNLMGVSPGEHLLMQGGWTHHPKFGRQFQIQEYQTLIPATVVGICKYLGSGLIRGIGPVMAERITQHFALETLRLIDEEPLRLQEVEGIGPIRCERIQQAWQEQKEIRQVMLFLKGHDVSTKYAVKIFKTYGQAAVRIVTQNPYRLAQDIWGIGFKTADRIATSLGTAKDAPQRLQAGLVHLLNEAASDEGHVFLPKSELLRRSSEILGVETRLLEAALQASQKEQGIKVDAQEDPAIYLPALHTSENGIAQRFLALCAGTPSTRGESQVSKWLSEFQQREKIEYSQQQRQAILAALQRKVLILTGGPGTGKTTTVKGLLHLMECMGWKILLAAPTGRAAKRLSESTGRPAQTIHRLLEFSPREGFLRNETHPLETNALIVDELSMVDVVLMHHLLKAVPPEASLVLIGDVDQLPAVGPGSVLQDLIRSGVAEVVQLTEIFRQAQQSQIITNSHRINRGEFPDLKAQSSGDFFFLQQEDPAAAAELILDLVTRRLPARYRYDPIDDIQVLCPMYRGEVGADQLNRALQERLNPAEELGLPHAGRELRVGDKVMQIRNNYEKDVFNGDIGRVLDVDRIEQQVSVLFPGRGRVEYEVADLSELVPAYAITVHKSQGSEYRAIVLPLLTQHYVMLQRNLLYTALTRAKELAVLVGTKKALMIAIKNNPVVQRNSQLALKLRHPTVPSQL
ncbi:ATP-dependent RecD-like DNA helicase [Candidatus Acetothermia bacterium]|nr:ATP-dependent RecD-like DNA helicase [Candidatus Acetothermia bacterium]